MAVLSVPYSAKPRSAGVRPGLQEPVEQVGGVDAQAELDARPDRRPIRGCPGARRWGWARRAGSTPGRSAPRRSRRPAPAAGPRGWRWRSDPRLLPGRRRLPAAAAPRRLPDGERAHLDRPALGREGSEGARPRQQGRAARQGDGRGHGHGEKDRVVPVDRRDAGKARAQSVDGNGLTAGLRYDVEAWVGCMHSDEWKEKLGGFVRKERKS